MNDGDGQPQEKRSWKQLYEAALLERDLTLLPQRIADAQNAIVERASALLVTNGNDNPEMERLTGAHVVLEDLKRIYQN